jgi:hypothetical protein
MTKLYCTNLLNEFDLQWKTTSTGRSPPMEDDLQWKTTSNRRRPPIEDDLQWKMTFNWRWPPMEDDLQWKTTSNGRRPPMEDELQWKTTSNGRRPPMENIIRGISQHTQIVNLSLYDQTIFCRPFKWRRPQNIKSGISQQLRIGSYSNLKLKLIWPNHIL